MKKLKVISEMDVNINKNRHGKRLIQICATALLAVSLTGCESAQMLDVSGLLSSGSDKSSGTAAKTQKADTSSAPAQAKTPGSEATGEENVVLEGPGSDISSKPEAYPSLTEQPDKPGKTLDAASKDREIRDLENLSQTHVKTREAELESRANPPARIKKPDDGGILGLGWLKLGKSKSSTKGPAARKLTPPEKLRLSRIKPVSPEISDKTDNSPTDVASLPDTTPGLRRKSIIPSVPEKKETAKVDVTVKPMVRKNAAKTSGRTEGRPSAQNPKIIRFSNGSRKLTANQQEQLDEIARYRDNSGSNIYVLGFSRADPKVNNEANIDSQDLAISRANLVAAGLRKRGFPVDQVVVQIIDEVLEKGKKPSNEFQRVEVYFENPQSAKITPPRTKRRKPKKSTLDFLKGKPFDYSGSEN